MNYRQLYKEGTEYVINNNKEETAALYLLEYATGLTSPQLFSKLGEEIKEGLYEKYKELLDEYVVKNRPVQYIIGEAIFYGYNFNVNEGVLIPRFETEELVENLLFKYDEFMKGRKVNVVDVATGSGCIGITLSLEEPNMNVTITDISNEALEVAKSNMLKLDANVEILQGDMLKPLKGRKFDILVSNPPYIPDSEFVEDIVRDNEPNIALFGGVDGLKFYHIILREAKEILNDQAIIAFEHGYDKKNEIETIARAYFPDAKIETLKDLQGKDRMTFVVIGF